MGFSYTISLSGNHIQIVGIGEITTLDCIEEIERVMSDPRCRPDSTALIDLRDATYKPRTQEEVIHIAEVLEMFSSMMQNNIAIVARRATLFPAEILSSHVRKAIDVKIRVFVDLAAAEAFCRGRHN